MVTRSRAGLNVQPFRHWGCPAKGELFFLLAQAARINLQTAPSSCRAVCNSNSVAASCPRHPLILIGPEPQPPPYLTLRRCYQQLVSYGSGDRIPPESHRFE